MKNTNMNVFLYSSEAAQSAGVTKDAIPPMFSRVKIEPDVINTALTPIADLI